VSQATEQLIFYRDEYRKEALSHSDAIRQYSEAKRALKEREQTIFAEATFSGKIDGKNAETRDAQAAIAYKEDTQWQHLVDVFRRAEEAQAATAVRKDLALTDLKVQAMLVNVEISESGAQRLLSEVSLAGV